MNKGKIGIAVLSFAHGHANVYCSRMMHFDDVSLVACWDDNPTRGQRAAEQFGMRYSPHLEDVLDDPNVHAVIVNCETNRHADLCVAAAEAGKAILCQKPMATTLADCDRIIAAVERTGVPFQMAFQMRCDPSNQKIKELIDAGAVGKVGTVRRRHCISVLFNPSFGTGDTAWHIDPVSNVGMFFDDAVHAADFLLWLLGPPISVMAEIDNVLTHHAPDDTGVAIYRYPDGAFAILYNSAVALAGENTTEVYGDQGVIIQNWDDATTTPFAPPGAKSVKWYRRGQKRQWEEFDIPVPRTHGERIGNVPRPFIDMLKRGSEPTVTARDGKISVEMILGAYRSAKEGRRVSLPLPPEE